MITDKLLKELWAQTSGKKDRKAAFSQLFKNFLAQNKRVAA